MNDTLGGEILKQVKRRERANDRKQQQNVLVKRKTLRMTAETDAITTQLLHAQLHSRVSRHAAVCSVAHQRPVGLLNAEPG